MRPQADADADADGERGEGVPVEKAFPLPIAFPWKRDHVEMQARQGVPARERDRVRGDFS